jgi:hypothetical protein
MALSMVVGVLLAVLAVRTTRDRLVLGHRVRPRRAGAVGGRPVGIWPVLDQTAAHAVPPRVAAVGHLLYGLVCAVYLARSPSGSHVGHQFAA